MLDLSYTEIKAPLAGRVGRAKYSVGDFVGPESGPLATIVAQDPVYVTFPVTQRQLLEIRRRAAAESTDQRDVVIRLRLADGSAYPQTGRLDFVDVRVDQGTDTVQVRAGMPNPDRLLIDGQLVTAVVETAKPEQALVIPQQALQADQAGMFVLVVDAEDKVQVRRVTIGAKLEAEVVVANGPRRGRPGDHRRCPEGPAAAGGPGRRGGGELGAMLSSIFIDRPRLSLVISIVITHRRPDRDQGAADRPVPGHRPAAGAGHRHAIPVPVPTWSSRPWRSRSNPQVVGVDKVLYMKSTERQ